MLQRLHITTALIFIFLIPHAQADERHLDFIDALQDRGYHDLVVEYLGLIRERPNLPEEVKALSDYLIGKSLLAGADQVTDLAKRDQQLQEARKYFEKFVQDQPQHARLAEAQMDLAQILVERGRVAILNAENPNNQEKRGQFQQDARKFFDEAGKSFAAAADRFQTEFTKFPPFLPETKKREREAKREAQLNLMQAQLHLGLVKYEFAQAYDKGTADYKSSLQQAVVVFEDIYSLYRSWLAGLHARMWEGKCFEEMGDLGKAEGFYKELLEHEDPALQALQRQVQFFMIIVMNKRGDQVLAADMSKKWLQEYSAYRHTETGLGVQFELAQSLIRQALEKPEQGPDRGRLISQAMTAIQDVTRYETIYKQPAIVLQQKYKGLVDRTGGVVTFDKALALGEAAKEVKNWAEAGRNYKQALRLASDKTDTDQLTYLRYVLGYCYLQTKDYYEACALSEYVARRHSKSSVAVFACNVAIAAYTGAYNDVQSKMKQSPEFEEARLLGLAEHLIKTWPTSSEANGARFTLAEIHLSHSRYGPAAVAFEGVTPESPDYTRALGRAGDAYWRSYVEGALMPEQERTPEQLAAWLQKARENLAKGVAEQVKNLKPDVPPPLELAEAEVNLAEVSLESGQAAEAIKLVQELVPKISAQKELQPLELRALVALLRGHVVTNDLKAAQDTMQAIEKTGKDLAQITRIYFDLGKQLQAELKRIEARNDVAALKRTRDSYVEFLSQMAARKEGQTFATLQWTGEAFFGLELYQQATDRFKEIIEHANNDPQFLDQAKAQNKGALTQVKLRLVTALRKQNLFDDAWELIKPQKESGSGDDPLHKAVVLNYEIVLERGLVLQEWGAKEPARLETAIKHWGFWAQRLEPMQQKPTAYFEIRLNLIRCLLKKGTAATDPKDRQESLRQAERQLLYMVKTSDQLGGPTLKAQFQQVQRDLEKQLGRPLQAAEATPATGKSVAKAP